MSFELPPPFSHPAYISNSTDLKLRGKIETLTARFQKRFIERVRIQSLPAYIVRPLLLFNAIFITDAKHLWIVGEVAKGLPFVREIALPDRIETRDAIERLARRELGIEDAFVVRLPLELIALLESDAEKLNPHFDRITDELVAEEYVRYRSQFNGFRYDPLFGDPPDQQKSDLCFVMAPWVRSDIYHHIIKPVVIQNELVCWRADDVAENKAIMTNIWRSICEARLLIADLTGGNANVFYELGIAHTIGKEVILIEERPSEGEVAPRMFDTYGLNAILYKPGTLGGQDLRDQLDARIKSTLARLLPVDALSQQYYI